MISRISQDFQHFLDFQDFHLGRDGSDGVQGSRGSVDGAPDAFQELTLRSVGPAGRDGIYGSAFTSEDLDRCRRLLEERRRSRGVVGAARAAGRDGRDGAPSTNY